MIKNILHYFFQKIITPEKNWLSEPKTYKSKILDENLPALEDETELCLHFLPGNMGNKDQESPLVKEILDNLESYQSYINIFLGVSGCGKTKSLIDIARNSHSIFFNLGPKVVKQQDILNLIERWKLMVNYI